MQSSATGRTLGEYRQHPDAQLGAIGAFFGGHMQLNLAAWFIGGLLSPATTCSKLDRTKAIAVVIMVMAQSTRAQLCDPELLPAPASSQPYTSINSATTWDPDGDGPIPRRLVTAEFFEDVVLGNSHSIIRWTEYTQWRETPFSRLDDRTRYTAMCEFDPDGDGPQPTLLAVARTIDHLASSEVTLFDGVSFAPLGELFNGTVHALCTVDHDADPATPKVLFATGDFGSNGATTLHYLGRWSGSAWVDVAGGLEWRAQRLTAWDSDGPGPLPEWLAVGGEFVRAGGVGGQGEGSLAAGGVAIWSHSQWSAMPSPLQYLTLNGASRPIVNDLATWDPDDAGPESPRLVVAGWFFTPDLTIRNLVAWDGHTMQGFGLTNGGAGVLGAGEIDHDFSPSTPRALIVVANSSFVPSAPAQVYVWNGDSFDPLSQDGFRTALAIKAIIPLDSTPHADQRVVFVGDFTRVGTLNVQSAVQWTSRGWAPISPSIANDTVPPLTSPSLMTVPREDGRGTSLLVTGISVRDHRGDRYAPLATWEGNWLTSVPQDVFASTRAAVLWDRDGSGPLGDSLVVAGKPLGSSFGAVYRRDGDQWVQLGDLLAEAPGQLAKWDHDGDPDTADILIARDSLFSSLYRFDGINWRRMLLPANVTPLQMCVADLDGAGDQPPALYVACAGAPQDAIRVFRNPNQESLQVGPGIVRASNPAVAAPARSLFTWDADGTGPVNPVLIWAGNSVRWQDQNEVLGLLAWNGSELTRVSTTGLSYEAPYVHSATAWSPDGLDAPQALAVNVSTRTVFVKHPSGNWAAVGDFSTNSVLVPWDIDGDGPMPEQLAIWGTQFDWTSRPVNYGLNVFARPIPWIAQAPFNSVGTQESTIQLTASPAWGYAERDEGLTYQWRRDGVPVINGPAGASPGGGTVSGASGTLFGTRDLTLSISGARRSDTGYYDLVVTNSCGTASSAAAEIYVEPACPADLDDSGELNDLDIARFLASYEFGHAEADLDRSGGVDASDLAAFFDSYASGCS